MIDCFMFLNEFDILDIRLNSLAPYVDRFVLCEAPFTHSGKPKPLYFNENKEKYKDFNITHLIVDDIVIPEKIEDITELALRLEAHHRDFLLNGIKDVDPETMILSSDVDEIPNLKDYDGKSEGSFREREYCYYFNVFTGKKRVRGTVSYRRKNITSLSKFRREGRLLPVVLKHGGWHFTFIGDDIVYKMDSGPHCLSGSEMYKEQILDNRKNLCSPYYGVWSLSRWRQRRFVIEEPSGPEWLLKNRERYKHLFYEDGI